MTPAARYGAAIDVLDAIAGGAAVEPALLNWARGHRFAGSKDRAALRDIVFSIERRRASCAAMGGGATGRALVRGYLAQEGVADSDVFGASTYAPGAITENDPPIRPWAELTEIERADLQPWVWERLKADHGEAAPDIAARLRHRAPVWVRANGAKATSEDILARLRADGFDPVPSLLCPTAIEIGARQRQLAQHDLVKDGSLEFQDLGPQLALAALAVDDGAEALDFCAGGGGKSLALAARGARVTAHDANPARMADLPARAVRAGAKINILQGPPEGQYDLVLCDVPCSGSGAWRRAVQGKWTLTEGQLGKLAQLQREIVQAAVLHVRDRGTLAYMTCSLFDAENQAQAARIAEDHAMILERQYTPAMGADGFYLAAFRVAK